jgi:hypothetical protein
VARTPYDIPGAIYDPSLQFNLLGIPKLADFFQDKDYLPGDNVDRDGTTVKSSGCCSCLTWDHGKHTRNFTHGDSTLPEIMLYQGHGYFDAFCTQLRCCYQDDVVFAFSSAFSISPSHIDNATIVLDGEIRMRRRRILQYLPSVGLKIMTKTVQRRKWNGSHLHLLPLLCHRRRLFQ